MRLTLDLEGVGLDTDQFPTPWQTEHEFHLKEALACYRRRTGRSVLTTGFVVHSDYDWLGCSPHGLVGHQGCVMFRCRKTLKAYRERIQLTDAEMARAQITMFVCGRSWCDVGDYLDGHGVVPDKLRIQRVEFDIGWVHAKIFPRLLSLWGSVRDVRARRG